MNKKKILALCLIVCLLAIAVVGGTLAYFTDTADATNTFTAGNVKIKLDEAVVTEVTDKDKDNYGDLVATSTRTEDGQEYELFPGMTVTKDPTITNTGSENAYVAAKITVTTASGKDAHSLIGIEYGHMLALQGFLSGGCAEVGAVPQTNHPLNERNGIRVYGDGTYSVWQEIIEDNGQYTYVFYVFIENELAAEESVVLFKKMHIDPKWTNEQMEIMNGLTIDIDAYGVQAHGFRNCYEAMVGAFGQNAGDPFYFG